MGLQLMRARARQELDGSTSALLLLQGGQEFGSTPATAVKTAKAILASYNRVDPVVLVLDAKTNMF